MAADGINIYIKASSRPAYLDRCIRSIRRNLHGYQRIIVLNDGIAPHFMERILRQHRNIGVVDSPRVGDGLPMDPAAFWVEQIQADPNDFFLLLEEDTWITHRFSLPLILRTVVLNDVIFFRLFWHGNPAMASADEVYLRTPCEDGNLIEYYAPVVRRKYDAFKMFYVAQGIYRRDYWVNCYEGIPYWADEDYVLNRAIQYVRARQGAVRFAKLGHEAIRHSVSSTGRADGGGIAIRTRIDNGLYNDIMNACWYRGELDPMCNYPHDFPEEYLLSFFRRELDPPRVDAWLAWKHEYIDLYRQMGCALE